MANTVSTLNGLFKDVFADKVEFLMPKNTIFQRDVAFIRQSQRPGELLSQPVVVKHEHGVTYAGQGAGSFALEATAAGQVAEAQVIGHNIALRSSLSIEAAARAANGGRQAFMRANAFLVEAMMQSIRKREEIDCIYGQIGLGTVSSYSNPTVTFTTATWAPGIWSGMEGAPVEVFNAALSTNRGNSTVAAVDLDARTIDFAADISGTTATDEIFFKTAVTVTATHRSKVSLHKILTNTGTLHNVSASSFSLWKSNTVSAGSGPLTFDIVQDAQSRAVEKGAEEDMTLLCNPKGWQDLIGDQAALRRHDGDNKSSKYEIGAETICFYGQTGKVDIKPSIYVKEGFAYLFAPGLFNRIGATDVTFNVPGRDDEFYDLLESSMGYQLRAYVNSTVFSRAPGKATLINNVVNA